MIYDSPHKKLLIVYRKPPMLVVMDAVSGKIVANLSAAGRSDDVTIDATSGMIYVPAGEGFVPLKSSAPESWRGLPRDAWLDFEVAVGIADRLNEAAAAS